MPPSLDATPPSSLAERLQDVTEALAAARTEEAVFDVVLHPVLDALGAIAGAVLLVSDEGDRLKVSAAQGYEERTPTVWQDGPLDSALPAGDAVRRREALFFEHEGDLARAYPNLKVHTNALPHVASAVLPVIKGETPLGALVLDFREPHAFTTNEKRFLRTLAAQCALAVSRARLTADLERQVEARTRDLAQARVAAEVLAGLGDAMQRADTPDQVADLALARLGPALRAQSMLVVRLAGEKIRMPVIWGDTPESIRSFMTRPHLTLRDTPILRRAFEQGAAVYLDDYTAEPGTVSTFPSLACAVEPIRTPDGALEGFLVAWRIKDHGAWQRRERDLLARAAGTLGLALERAASAERIEQDARAHEAFVAFTEAVGTETDALALAQQAIAVLRARFENGTVVYYTRAGDLWKARAWSEDLSDALVASLTAGLPSDTPLVRATIESGTVHFTEAWNANTERIEHSEEYGTAAGYSLREDGEVRHLLLFGLKHTTGWSERDRALVRAVGRGLQIGLDRAEQARRLAEQNAELDARTKALEAFADLTRDLAVQSDPRALAARAQEVALSLLPPGYALYSEPENGRWVKRMQTGEVPDPAVQAFVDAGVPFEATAQLVRPFEASPPVYQDTYQVGGNDVDPALTAGIGATATVPVLVHGAARGLLIVVLFDPHVWTATDRALLETTARSLGLALERAEAVRSLATAEHRLRTVVRRTPVVLFALDQKGVFTLSEGSGLSGLGLTAGEVVGRSALELNADSPDTVASLQRALAGEEVHALVPVAGRMFDTWYAPLVENGSMTGVVGIATDMTEREADRKALERANQELRRSNAELEQFAYIASHDLQAPLRAVTSFADVIERRYGEHLDDKGKLYLRQIVQNGTHMKRLVDDLLAFSRLHTERRDPMPVDVGAALDRVTQRLTADIEAVNGEVTGEGLPLVLADPGQLDSLLQNLVGNGLKYRREGVAPRVRVSAQRDGVMWRFAVSDNGIGIDAAYWKRIFEIFQRLHTREQFEGTGIGLAVCKKIVERHGGQMWLESVPGEGSTFFFTLPSV